MKRKATLLVVGLIIMAMTTTGCLLWKPKVAQVVGGVTYVGGEPVVGANVKLDKHTTTTDENGSFTFSDIPYGDFGLEVVVDDTRVAYRRVTIAKPQVSIDIADVGSVDEPVGPGVIVFQSDYSGAWHVYRANADGTNIEQITHGTGDKLRPRLSPDGSKVAYNAQVDGRWQVFVVNADGTDVKQVTWGESNHFFPAWSPDGTRLAIEYEQQIYTINVDGTELTQVTDAPGSNRQPTWSPNSTRLIYNSNRTGRDELYVVNVDGTGDERITDNPGQSRFPHWSPDGSRILFTSTRDDITANSLYVMDKDGSNVELLIHMQGAKSENASWSW